MVKQMKRKPKKLKSAGSLFEPELIVAHLLGGTNGFNFERHRTPQEIQSLVQEAVDVMREIEKQCREQ
jgi:hypothetical protein